MFAASKTATSAGGTDPQFNYVTMLLHGDGTNGGQNNTFVDSSTNNFTITRNGNPTQGSFSPYGANWSNYFDGTSKISRSMSGVTVGTGQFTAEVWVCLTKEQTTYGVVFKCSDDDSWNNGWNIAFDSGGKIGTYNGGGTTNGIQTLTVGTWYHLALTRDSSNTLRFFINGVLSGSNTGVTTSYSSTTLTIGNDVTSSYPITGYVSNARIVNGSALYTSSFTPSTTPLTAVSGTQLLTCQSNRFIDNSSNNFALTITGTPSVQRFSPFAPSAAYSTATIGGSGYFDGSGDYLSVPASSSWVTGSSGSVTIEFWANADANNYYYLMDQGAGNEAAIAIGFGVSTGYIYWYNGNASVFLADISSLTIPAGTWNHFAFVINAGVPKVYLNGVLQSGTYTNNAFGVNATLSIGRYSGGTSYNFKGYISNFRFVSGQAIYTANFTPPTAPLTAVTNTQLLLSMTNGAIFDNAMMNDLETVGNAQISTSVVKYGTGSLYFDGTGDYLIGPSTPNTNIDAGNFTFEAWVYLTDATQVNPIVAKGFGAAGGYMMWVQSTLRVRVYDSGGTSYTATSTGTIPNNTWTFVAGVRNGNTITLYINGTADGSVSYSGTSTNSNPIEVGGYGTGAAVTNGYIDDLRITKGYARYTANFTPPAQAFPNN